MKVLIVYLASHHVSIFFFFFFFCYTLLKSLLYNKTFETIERMHILS